MVCPVCDGEWKVKKISKFFSFGGKKRHVCSKCGYVDERDCWVDDEYIGPKDVDPHSIDPKKIQEKEDAVEFYDKHRMPCCGSTNFIEGPKGGASINIECSKCKKKFNVSLDFPQLRLIERI
jgi:hypothetical protein